MTRTRLTVSVGGGGVGKTTTSAALAVSLARQHRRTLVITVDPARRLADALGTEIGQDAVPVQFDPQSANWLHARMPDPRASTDEFFLWLFQDPSRRQRVLSNPVYRELGDSLAGAYELVTIGLLQREVDSGRYDDIVLDTAPSRHALAFLTYPNRLLGLLEARALSWLASLAHAAEVSISEPPPSRSGILGWGRSKVESMMGRLLGMEGLRNLSSLFGDMVAVRERWASLARRTEQMLHDAATRYFIVGAPTGSAMADVAYLIANLKQNDLKPSTIVLNRAEHEPPESEMVLMKALEGNNPVQLDPAQRQTLLQALHRLRQEHELRSQAANRACDDLKTIAPKGTRLIRLPLVHRSEPRAIVLALANAWAQAGLEE